MMDAKDNKKILKVILVLGILLIFIGVIVYMFLTKDTVVEKDNLRIVYGNKENISIKGIGDNFSFEKEITVKNIGDQNQTYTIEWKDVENNFEVKTNLLYSVTAEGEGTTGLENIQVPVSTSRIFNQVVIEPGALHTYKINISYKGNASKESSSTFNANLSVITGVSKETNETLEKFQKILDDIKKKQSTNKNNIFKK